MEKKTYGAPRLVDWVAQIKAGSATVRVHFTGGALTSYGVTPAEYTTTNPFIQKVIEQSSYFKEGRIILLRSTSMADGEKPTEGAKSEDRKSVVEAEQAAEKEVHAEATDSVTTVEAGCLQDAQAYLQEHFNISSFKVRSYEAAQRAASERGVRFVGGKFDAVSVSETDN